MLLYGRRKGRRCRKSRSPETWVAGNRRKHHQGHSRTPWRLEGKVGPRRESHQPPPRVSRPAPLSGISRWPPFALTLHWGVLCLERDHSCRGAPLSPPSVRQAAPPITLPCQLSLKQSPLFKILPSLLCMGLRSVPGLEWTLSFPARPLRWPPDVQWHWCVAGIRQLWAG